MGQAKTTKAVGHVGQSGTERDNRRAARGSLTGRFTRRDDGLPNLRGAITIEVDLKAGSKLWVRGTTRSLNGPYGGDWAIELAGEVAHRGPRRGRPRKLPPIEPEGLFRDRNPPQSSKG